MFTVNKEVIVVDAHLSVRFGYKKISGVIKWFMAT